MSDVVIIAALAAFGLVLGGVLVELVRARRATAAVAAAVFVPGGERLGDLVAGTRDLVAAQGVRLAVIERHADVHLRMPRPRNGRRF